MAKRLAGRYGYPATRPFQFTLHQDRLEMPLHWRRPRMVFVDSMSDFFYPYQSEQHYRFLAACFGIMAYCNWHTFQILTKRPQDAIRFFSWLEGHVFDRHKPMEIRDFCAGMAHRHVKQIPQKAYMKTWPLPNVWILVSTETQETFNARVPYLFGIPSVVHGVSMEPMLGPISFRIPSKHLYDTPLDKNFGKLRGAPAEAKKLDWIIVGCEKIGNRPGRPFDREWARYVRDQCIENDIRFYFKQCPVKGCVEESPILDGRIWNEFPDHLEFTPADWKEHLAK